MKLLLTCAALAAIMMITAGCGDDTRYYFEQSSSSAMSESSQSSSSSVSSSSVPGASSSEQSVSSSSVPTASSSEQSTSSEESCTTGGVKMQSGVIKDIDAPLFGADVYQLFATTYTGLSSGWTDFATGPMSGNTTVRVVTPIVVQGERAAIDRYRDKYGVHDINDSEFTLTFPANSFVFFGVDMHDCDVSIRVESDQLSDVAFAPDPL